MKEEKRNAMSREIADRLRSPTWSVELQQKVETARRQKNQSRARLLVAMAFFSVAGWLTTDELLEEANSPDNIYAMVEDVTFSPFPGPLVE